MATGCSLNLSMRAAVVFSILSFLKSTMAQEVAEHTLPGCAETACFSLLQLSGKEISLSDVSNRFREQVTDFVPLRVSILNLRNAASSFGLETKAIRIDPSRVKELPLPCIVYFRPGRFVANQPVTTGHFLTIARVEGDHFRGFDWSPLSRNPERTFPISAFHKSWDGEAIIIRQSGLTPWGITLGIMIVSLGASAFIAKSILARKRRVISIVTLFMGAGLLLGCGRSSNQSAPSSPIVIAAPTQNFGVVDSSRMIEAKFPFTVWDRGTAKITGISKSCNCTTVNSDIIGRILEAGTSEHLILTIKPDGTPAQAVARTVEVTTDPPSTPPLVVAVTYRPCGAPRLSVAELVVESEPGKDAFAQFEITHHRSPADRQVKLKRSESDFGDFELQRDTTKTEEVLVPGVGEQKLMIDTTEVRLRSQKRHGYGEFRSLIKLAFENNPPITLPTVIRAKHPYALAIKRGFCGRLKPGQDWSISVPLRRADSKIDIETAVCEPSTIRAAFSENAVVLSGESPRNVGRFEGSLTITFRGDSLPPVIFPVSGIVIDD